jgi:hypothetical protein
LGHVLDRTFMTFYLVSLLNQTVLPCSPASLSFSPQWPGMEVTCLGPTASPYRPSLCLTICLTEGTGHEHVEFAIQPASFIPVQFCFALK